MKRIIIVLLLMLVARNESFCQSNLICSLGYMASIGISYYLSVDQTISGTTV